MSETAAARRGRICPFGVAGDEPLFPWGDQLISLRQAVWYGYCTPAEANELRPDDYDGLAPKDTTSSEQA
jgi:hypothetical protein